MLLESLIFSLYLFRQYETARVSLILVIKFKENYIGKKKLIIICVSFGQLGISSTVSGVATSWIGNPDL